jgi:hypothetical protein
MIAPTPAHTVEVNSAYAFVAGVCSRIRLKRDEQFHYSPLFSTTC